MPDIHPLLGNDWEPYDLGVMGELDVRILVELFGGREIADGLAPEWNGGIYYAAQRKSASPAEKETAASIGLLYYSKWKNPDSASSFLRVYANQLPRKYSSLARRQKDEAGADEQVYSTNEGDVLLSISGSTVFVSEGFDLAVARKLRDSIRDEQPKGPIRLAQAGHEPTLSLARLLGSYGVMKPALRERYTSQGLTLPEPAAR
jgi:hypothetical protein